MSTSATSLGLTDSDTFGDLDAEGTGVPFIMPMNSSHSKSTGKLTAQPALIYASDTEKNPRFRIVDHDFHCFIGSSDEYLVNELTYDRRSGLESIKHGDIIYRIRYSSPLTLEVRYNLNKSIPARAVCYPKG